MELHLRITGTLLIALAFLHVFFPKQFKWKKELAGLSLLNHQMMYVHTFFVALSIFLMGILSICCAQDLVDTSFGRKISLGIAVFWGIRLLFQFFVYSPKLWMGKKFETAMHILFSIMWMYITFVFFMIYYRG